jgi:2,3-bisphosphoglycerate-independent phosphoglycerate mutase
LGPEDETNPIFLADTPVMDRLWRSYPHAALEASGEAVGLKPGMKGNSEAGHMNIGAGRIVLQDEVRMDQAIKDGSFYTNEAFLKAINDAKSRGGALHLLGLLSKKSSHGTMDYPLAILEIAKREHLNEVYVHFIIDGRSTDPGSAPALLREFEEKANEIGLGEIVTSVGRGYALDRDRNYQERTKVAYDALVFGEGYHVAAFSSDD